MSKIVIDWGTSCFRAYQLDEKGMLVQEINEGEGAAQLNSRRPADVSADVFFAEYLKDKLSAWDYDRATPHILVGMVGSSVGWKNVAPLSCPTGFAQSSTQIESIDYESPAVIIRGLSCSNQWGNPDFMRGEEAQIFGWWLLSGKPEGRFMLCLPGTHTKWALLENGIATHFNTAMSGELYHLLTNYSILKAPSQAYDESAFLQGVSHAAEAPELLHQLFSCRSKVLTGELSGNAHHSYLSGLLLGTEIVSLSASTKDLADLPMAIIGNDHLAKLYALAIEKINDRASSSGVELYGAKDCLIEYARHIEI